MNNSRFEDNNLRPTYMSQLEANELMELWAERQREESARQSLITVHDVAEATQLSVQDVERLLQEIRTRQPAKKWTGAEHAVVAPTKAQYEPTLSEAYVRLAPLTGLIAFLYWLTLMFRSAPYMPFIEKLFHGGNLLWFLYAVVIAIVFLPKHLRQKAASEQFRKSQELAR